MSFDSCMMSAAYALHETNKTLSNLNTFNSKKLVEIQEITVSTDILSIISNGGSSEESKARAIDEPIAKMPDAEARAIDKLIAEMPDAENAPIVEGSSKKSSGNRNTARKTLLLRLAIPVQLEDAGFNI